MRRENTVKFLKYVCFRDKTFRKPRTGKTEIKFYNDHEKEIKIRGLSEVVRIES